MRKVTVGIWTLSTYHQKVIIDTSVDAERLYNQEALDYASANGLITAGKFNGQTVKHVVVAMTTPANVLIITEDSQMNGNSPVVTVSQEMIVTVAYVDDVIVCNGNCREASKIGGTDTFHFYPDVAR